MIKIPTTMDNIRGHALIITAKAKRKANMLASDAMVTAGNVCIGLGKNVTSIGETVMDKGMKNDR